MTIPEMEQELSEREYRDHWNAIDAEVATEEPCPDCGGPLKYRGFKHDVKDSYRAFVICDKCDTANEF